MGPGGIRLNVDHDRRPIWTIFPDAPSNTSCRADEHRGSQVRGRDTPLNAIRRWCGHVSQELCGSLPQSSLLPYVGVKSWPLPTRGSKSRNSVARPSVTLRNTEFGPQVCIPRVGEIPRLTIERCGARRRTAQSRSLSFNYALASRFDDRPRKGCCRRGKIAKRRSGPTLATALA